MRVNVICFHKNSASLTFYVPEVKVKDKVMFSLFFLYLSLNQILKGENLAGFIHCLTKCCHMGIAKRSNVN